VPVQPRRPGQRIATASPRSAAIRGRAAAMLLVAFTRKCYTPRPAGSG
jgi:hypothetical protein